MRYSPYEKVKLMVIGIVLILMGILAMGYSIYTGSYASLFWLCYIGLILMGIGALIKSGDLLMSQIAILTLPAIIWGVDFAYQIIFKQPLFGITNYFFASDYSLLQKIISLQHIFAIPLALYALSIIKLREIDMWIWAFGEAVIVYVLTLMFTNKIYNVNYVSSAPFLVADFGNYYPFLWMGIAFLGIYATNWVIIRMNAFNR